MKVEEALLFGTRYLTEKGLDSPRRDSELLLRTILKRDLSFLYAHPETALTSEEVHQFKGWLKKRGQQYPIQYLRGVQEFYGRDFIVRPGVLIPRPETEVLIETALRILSGSATGAHRILDIGTGSGCLAVTLACEQPALEVVATDLSAEAIELARLNARKAGCQRRLFLLQADICSCLQAEPLFDLIISNPPYVPAEQASEIDVSVLTYEPHMAVFAGEGGLDVYRKIFSECPSRIRPAGRLLVELGHGIHDEVVRTGCSAGWIHCETVLDLAGVERCAVFAPPRVGPQPV